MFRGGVNVLNGLEGPLLDVYETDTLVNVQVQLPGVKPEEVEITLSGTALTSKSERRREAEVQEAHMMRHIRGIVMVLLAGIVLVACGNEEAPRLIRVGEADRAHTIELRVGDQLEVVLEGNPTTGYQWERVDDATTVLKTAGEPRFSPASSAIGSGGRVSTLFEATSAGEARLQLQYHRTFEPNVPPLDTFDLTVVVQ